MQAIVVWNIQNAQLQFKGTVVFGVNFGVLEHFMKVMKLFVQNMYVSNPISIAFKSWWETEFVMTITIPNFVIGIQEIVVDKAEM